MQQGLFPSQQRALRQAFKKADAFDHFRQRTRRAFLSMLLGGAGMGAGMTAAGYWLGRRHGATAAQPARHPDVEWMHALVRGPLADLEAAAPNLTATIDLHGGDADLWLGFERLVLTALAHGDRQSLARDLLVLARVAPPPAHLHALVERLDVKYR